MRRLFFIVFCMWTLPVWGRPFQDSLQAWPAELDYSVDSTYRCHDQQIFFPGEVMEYQLFFSFIKVGEATMKIDRSLYEVSSRPCYYVKVDGKTTGFFSTIAKIRNTWGSFIDTVSIVPQLFYRNIREMKYRKKEIYLFDHKYDTVYVEHRDKKSGKYRKTTSFRVPNNVQDMISGFYYLRTLDFDTIRSGDVFTVPGFYKDSVYNLHVKYLRREIINTKLGKRVALVMQPFMPDNGVFNKGSSITAWISDDDYRIPLKVKANLKVGAGIVEIKRYIPGRTLRDKVKDLPPLRSFVRPRF
ncbi:MAG: DUF3108 domain-containing protein [Cytophagales bacterium]|nr:DUF3108 domain-containing protein [Cytophagales bacterium]